MVMVKHFYNGEGVKSFPLCAIWSWGKVQTGSLEIYISFTPLPCTY